VARESTEDFVTLLAYLESYSLKSNVDNAAYLHELKSWHRKLFAMLVFEAESRHLTTHAVFGDTGGQYFAESCSDFAQACFCWMHGAYKPAAIMLRSGIETFVKACVADNRPDLLTESSVFELMAAASHEPSFLGDSAVLFHRLRNEYGVLCATVHSATPADFGNIGALRLFPKFDEDDALPIARQACVISDRILGVLLCHGRQALKHFHHRNRENFLNGIPPSIKGPILQLDST